MEYLRPDIPPNTFTPGISFMAKPLQKQPVENLDEMLKRIRQENMALQRLIDAVKNLPAYPEKSNPNK